MQRRCKFESVKTEPTNIVCVILTWRDVELVANGEAPHASSDARRKSLPPELPDPPRSLPTHRHTRLNRRAAHTHTHAALRRPTWCPSAAGSPCSRSPWRWRCCPPACVVPSSDASSSGPPSALRETEDKKISFKLLFFLGGGSEGKTSYLSSWLLPPSPRTPFCVSEFPPEIWWAGS